MTEDQIEEIQDAMVSATNMVVEQIMSQTGLQAELLTDLFVNTHSMDDDGASHVATGVVITGVITSLEEILGGELMLESMSEIEITMLKQRLDGIWQRAQELCLEYSHRDEESEPSPKSTHADIATIIPFNNKH